MISASKWAPMLLTGALLLIVVPALAQQKAKPEADNGPCLVCHLNFGFEELATTHASANVGCIRCHGISMAHSEDEENTTPPDQMFAKAKVNSSCLECHEKGSLSDTHKPVLSGEATENKYCSDCHGKHRLSRRTVRWNKDTGELVTDAHGK